VDPVHPRLLGYKSGSWLSVIWGSPVRGLPKRRSVLLLLARHFGPIVLSGYLAVKTHWLRWDFSFLFAIWAIHRLPTLRAKRVLTEHKQSCVAVALDHAQYKSIFHALILLDPACLPQQSTLMTIIKRPGAIAPGLLHIAPHPFESRLVRSSLIKLCMSPYRRQPARQLAFTTSNSRFQ